MPIDEPTTPEQTPTFVPRRTDNFVSSYANSAVVDATAWDMKIIFGQFDKTADRTFLNEHLAVSIPWGVAKLMLYWMQIQIAAYESDTGKTIGIRNNLRPDPPPPLTPEQQNNPVMKKYHEAITKLHEEFIASLA